MLVLKTHLDSHYSLTLDFRRYLYLCPNLPLGINRRHSQIHKLFDRPSLYLACHLVATEPETLVNRSLTAWIVIIARTEHMITHAITLAMRHALISRHH